MISLPAPNLAPQPITYEEFLELMPEKLEWVDGHLFDLTCGRGNDAKWLWQEPLPSLHPPKLTGNYRGRGPA